MMSWGEENTKSPPYYIRCKNENYVFLQSSQNATADAAATFSESTALYMGILTT